MCILAMHVCVNSCMEQCEFAVAGGGPGCVHVFVCAPCQQRQHSEALCVCVGEEMWLLGVHTHGCTLLCGIRIV